MPLVSVIIPTYQRLEFTQEAIESVLAQTFQDFEIIVVFDGEDIRTVEHSKSRNSIKYYSRKHKGVSAARNFGVNVSFGKYIAFLDSDDLWDRRKLEKQLEYLTKLNEEPRRLASGSEPFRFCYTNEKWIRNGQHLNQLKKHQKYHGWIFDRCLPLCIISASSIIMERAVFEALGGFDESLFVCEDYDLWLRMSLKYPIAFLDENLIIKRGGHADQLSKKYWGMDRFRIKALEKLLKKELEPKETKLVMAELESKYKILLIGSLKRKKIFSWLYYKLKQRLRMMRRPN
ncbi:glycosyl transferase [Candidatus Saganbacteria bacterium CG08_land_8_20_14_0_20_45_16]|uniref:Glycosyl transferase n=1 Tax=Candidatus Saganbacteria bacterium CG08_land_8_20_14_0_20_45_16 TaxID=2014293 RepID=A0A2H0XUR0_UNCSA|nr:MAG: glycosyl transferase [Candidatus Saganbacteria bacterium CG08_land_8_20_14_0_20_45_16]